ncbi:uncharacterized protein LOC133908408 [Phragmites australis]|uniref:uncharacterized protein LOC133908408 n=1 Tax=Phragmites australis TaxID=29695 RepID=UPI002D78DFC3|nr:uncharacterized protein LOC133908408 [Phragmites australis]
MEDRGQGPAENLAESLATAAADTVVDGDDGSEGEDDGFSFPVPPLAADACIVPVYPIFGRPPSPPLPREDEEEEPKTATVRVPLGRLLLEEREFRARQRDGRSTAATRALPQEDDDEASAGGDEELEGVPPETYCLWAPGGQSAPASLRRSLKSSSTGSVLRWRRISERLVGRSHSDGKEKFVFLRAAGGPEPPPSNKEKEEGRGSNKGGDAGAMGHQWSYCGRGGSGGSRRRSYPPYRQELVGLFANVGGLRRSYHPF